MGDNANGEKPAGNGKPEENKSGTGDAAENAGTEQAETEKPKGKLMTQAEIDEIVQKRLDRERKKDKENAELSETDRLKKENAELQAKAREGDTRDSFVAKLGPGVEYAQASRFFKMVKPDIEYDDRGKPENLDELVKDLKAEFPQIFTGKKGGGQAPRGGADGGAGSGNDGKGAGGMNALIRGAKK